MRESRSISVCLRLSVGMRPRTSLSLLLVAILCLHVCFFICRCNLFVGSPFPSLTLPQTIDDGATAREGATARFSPPTPLGCNCPGRVCLAGPPCLILHHESKRRHVGASTSLHVHTRIHRRIPASSRCTAHCWRCKTLVEETYVVDKRPCVHRWVKRTSDTVEKEKGAIEAQAKSQHSTRTSPKNNTHQHVWTWVQHKSKWSGENKSLAKHMGTSGSEMDRNRTENCAGKKQSMALCHKCRGKRPWPIASTSTRVGNEFVGSPRKTPFGSIPLRRGATLPRNFENHTRVPACRFPSSSSA